jgi:hypothetical protein
LQGKCQIEFYQHRRAISHPFVLFSGTAPNTGTGDIVIAEDGHDFVGELAEVDIDRLAEELRRSAWLLEFCRGKIRKAEAEVTQIVQSLERDEDG